MQCPSKKTGLNLKWLVKREAVISRFYVQA